MPSLGRVVLVVEDESLIGWNLRFLLERQGWRVLGPAVTVAEALALLAEHGPPDLALLDFNLHGQPVTPVAEQLRANSVPFVLASGYGSAIRQVPVLRDVPNVGKITDERELRDALHRALGY